MKLVTSLLLFISLVFVTPIYAQESRYDLNKVRFKIFHLLNLFASDDTLATPPAGGKRITPTPSQPGGSTVVITRIFYTEAGVEKDLGTGTYTPGSGYRLQITKQVTIPSLSVPTNKYYMWLVKTSLTPPAAERITSFNTSSLPPVDQVFPKDLSGYNQLIITEEDPTKNPTAPNLSVPPPFTAVQRPNAPANTPTPQAGATPTAVPASPTPSQAPPTPTPGGSGRSSSMFDIIKTIFGFES